MADITDTEPRDVLLTDVRTEEDMVLARHALQAAHARRGALVVLDLRHVQPWDGWDPRAALSEFADTASGNGQSLAVLGLPGALGLPPPPSGGFPFFPDLGACLRQQAPVGDRAHALRITIPARLEHVPQIKGHVAAAVRTLHGDADAFQTEILVDELVVNAVENSPSARNTVDLLACIENHELILEVTNDFDDSIDSERIMNRRLQSFDASGGYLGERGRGLFLVARMADGLQIRSVEGDRIRVTVTKRLRPRS